MSYIITVKMHKVSMLIVAIIVEQGAPRQPADTLFFYVQQPKEYVVSSLFNVPTP